MVFTILIGSQVLNAGRQVISYGGEHYIQQYLRSFDNEVTIFLIVMVLLFLLGFVLDFLEIIYIVVPIVGPVIYGGTVDPAWVTIMIAINLQTSFLTPPFGFALFYLRGVAQCLTTDIYRGVIPFVIIQIVGLLILWFFPEIVTIVPLRQLRRKSLPIRTMPWTMSISFLIWKRPPPGRLFRHSYGQDRRPGQAGAFCPRIFSSAVSRLVTVRSISISLSRPNSPMRKLA